MTTQQIKIRWWEAVCNGDTETRTQCERALDKSNPEAAEKAREELAFDGWFGGYLRSLGVGTEVGA